MACADPSLSLDREVRAGDLRGRDVVLGLAARAGYSWGAAIVRRRHVE